MGNDSAIPSAKGAIPVLGHAWSLARNPLRFLSALPADADLVRIRLGSTQVILVCDPDLTHQVLTDDRTFDKGGPLTDVISSLVGDGLVTCPRHRHRQPRRLLQPLFHPSRLQAYSDAMAPAIEPVIAGWRDGQVIDVPVEMRRLTIRVAVEILFSGAFPPAAVEQIVDDFTTILVGFAQRLSRPPVFDLLPTRTNRRYRAALERVRQTVADVIADRDANGSADDDLLAALLSKDAEGVHLFGATARLDHAITFLIAPTATVASVLGWALHTLAKRPDLQIRLQAEVDAVLNGASAGYAHVPQLELTRRIITETLRRYPSLWFGPVRIVTTETRLGGHVIPAGTVIAYSPYHIQHRSELFDDPERFDPDRWTQTELPAPSRGAFIPFGGGARQCIASEFAFHEMVIALASITSRWRLEPVPGSPFRTRAAVNLTAIGLRLHVIDRASVTGKRRRRLRDLVRIEGGTVKGHRRPTRRRSLMV